jgi:hypothetical protein
MPNTELLTHLRDYLAAPAQGSLVRDPRVAGAAPPFWRSPGEGAIAPGEKTGDENDDRLVVSAFRQPGPTSPVAEQPHWRYAVVDLWIRATVQPQAWELDAAIRPLLVGVGAPKQSFDMAGLTVIAASQFRELQPLGRVEGTTSAGAKIIVFGFTSSWLFQLYD